MKRPPAVGTGSAGAGEGFYRAIVEAAAEAVLVLERDCRVRYLSPSMAGLLGRGREEVEGRDFRLFFLREDRKRCRVALEEALEAPGRMVRFALRGGGAEGAPRDLEAVACNLLEDPEVRGIVLDFHDVTEYGRELESLSRDLRAFAQALAHDLKSPLTHAYACALTIEGRSADALDGIGRKGIRAIRDSLESMNAIIEGMLAGAAGSVAKGRGSLVDLCLVVEEAVGEVELCGGLEGVMFSVDTALPAVRCDPARLRQVLRNLVSNAAKFAAAAGREKPRIEVGVEETGSGRAVYVRDNGPGIRREDLERVFEPLARAAGSEGLPGHGLGLAIVRRVVESWGGRAWAESEYGRGATFYFTLPEAA